MKDDILGFKRIIHFYNLWQRNKDIPQNFLLVSYENLINNGIQELQRIVKQAMNSSEKTILIAIYNNQNQRRYIGIKLD